MIRSSSKKAEISGKGTIIRADGTEIPFELKGSTDLSEEEFNEFKENNISKNQEEK